MPATSSPWAIRLAAVLVVFAVLIAYAGTLHAPFVFDDNGAIVDNPTIRHLWPLHDALWAPGSATGAAGRPLVNLSLALNYALGGLNPLGYHIFNLLVHALAALVLFGLVRRTLLRPVLQERFGAHATSLAFVMVLLWAIHPLLTESVTFTIQRTESLSGLFYLLTLYGFARSQAEGERALRWMLVSVGACVAGMLTKETVVTVPVIVLLYDRTFVSGNFKNAWQSHGRYYCALAATWLLLAFLVAANNNRSGVVGLGLGVSAWDYALTQCRAIILYLKLSFWPHPLVVDYGAGLIRSPAAVWWQGVLLLALVAGTFVALVRRPVVGFLAFTFFAILAPSSSFVPLITQTMAEHRMYLPLAAVIILVSAAFHLRWPKWTIPVMLVLAVAAAVGTIRRNEDYRTVMGLWEITVADWPGNARAHTNLGGFYAQANRLDEAIAQFETAIRLNPHFAEAEFDLGNALGQSGRYAASVEHYRRAIHIKPDYALAHYWLAFSLMRTGQIDEALEQCDISNRLAPHQPVTLHSYASILTYAGRLDEARARYEEALALTPDDAALQHETGILLVRMNRPLEALPHLEKAVALAPDQGPARYALAMLLMQLGRYAAAADQFAQVLRTQPNFAEAHEGLGRARLAQERWDEAVTEFQAVLRLKPGSPDAQSDLERAELLRDLRGSK